MIKKSENKKWKHTFGIRSNQKDQDLKVERIKLEIIKDIVINFEVEFRLRPGAGIKKGIFRLRRKF